MTLPSGIKNFLATVLLLIAVLALSAGPPGTDSIPHSKPGPGRLPYVAGLQAAGYSTALVALNHAWYKDHPRTSFHFHNDLPDWFQMDKLGHLASTYHLSRLSAASLHWAGLDNSKGAWWGVASGFGFMTAIEILDGYSLKWGASLSDMAANTLGAATFLSQQLFWEEQRFSVKYSFSQSDLAQYRPALLGNTLPERMLKDYNGQTLWLSMNIRSFLSPDSHFPPWLNLALGHGAYGMLGSRENPSFHNGIALPDMNRYRQWYLAPDIDFTKIPLSNPWIKSLFSALNFLKMPSPAIEYNPETGWHFHWLFF